MEPNDVSEIVRHALVFLNRCPLKGNEAYPYLQVVEFLKDLAKGELVVKNKNFTETLDMVSRLQKFESEPEPEPESEPELPEPEPPIGDGIELEKDEFDMEEERDFDDGMDSVEDEL